MTVESSWSPNISLNQILMPVECVKATESQGASIDVSASVELTLTKRSSFDIEASRTEMASFSEV